MLSPEQDNTENFEGSDIDSHSDLNEVEDEAVDDKADIDDTEDVDEINDECLLEDKDNVLEDSVQASFYENPDTADSSPEDDSYSTSNKTVRFKKTPVRYEDCMMGDSPTTDLLDDDIENDKTKSSKKIKSVKFALDDLTQDGALSEENAIDLPAYNFNYDKDRGAGFDAEGNFRFKLTKDHMIRSRTGGLTSYRCDICEMIFPRSFSLRRHYERIHINPRFVRNKGKKDQEVVRKLIDDDRKKQVEKKNQSTENSDNDNSSNTAKSNNQEKEDTSFYVYACKLCSRYQVFFKTKELLRKHYQNRHTAVARKKMDAYKCDSCDRSYMTRHELQRHKRSHSGERPYACRYCAKRFPTSTNARRHERTHTGDRPHTCKVCNKRFIQRTDMLKHLRTVHRMKVTRTKAEKLRYIDDAAADDEVGNNQFEENIDFAAYLNLDQFEKGSLMGGSEVEKQISNPSSTSIPIQQEDKEKSSKERSAVAKAADEEQDKEVPHKCPECFKVFNSRVNMRRHYRLKHERNQVLRSALPVSMVVKKFKIQETDENQWKDDIIERIQNLDKMVTKKAEDKSKSPSISSKDQVEPSSDVSTTKPSPSSVESIFKLSPSNKVFPTKSSKSKQGGSKLGQILEKLTMKKAEKSVPPPTSSNQSRKENLISSATLLQSMQPLKKKNPVRFDVFSKSSTPQRSSPKVTKEKKDSEANFLSSVNKMRQALDDRIRNQEEMIRKHDLKLRMHKEKSEMKFHPYSRSSRHSWEGSKNVLGRHGMSSFKPSTQMFKNYAHNRSFMDEKRRDMWKEANVGRSSRLSTDLNRKKSFLDNCWNTKMNTASQQRTYSKQSPDWRPNISGFSKVNPNFPGSHSSRFSSSDRLDSPLNLEQPTRIPQSSEPSSSNAPLDLSNPKKSSPDFKVTDSGILDLSKKSKNNSFEEKKSSSTGNLPKDFPKKEDSDFYPFYDKRMMMEKSQRGISQGNFWSARAERRSVFDEREPRYSISNAPLKFHNVKFNKERRVHGAGTAGRPSNSLYSSNHYRRFSHQGPNPSAVVNQSLGSQFMEHYRCPQASSRDRIMPHRSQNNALMSRFNRDHKEAMSRNQQHLVNSIDGHLNPMLRHPSSNVFSYSNSSPNFSTHSPKAAPRYPVSNSNTSSSFSMVKHRAKDSRRVYSSLYPSNSETSSRLFPANSKNNHRLFPSNSDAPLRGDQISSRSNNFNEDDVMRRCIRKAQHELLRKGSSGDPAGVRNLSKKVFKPSQIKEESFLESSVSDTCNEPPSSTSPLPFLIPSKQGLDPNFARDKLTMTPGFDTNGEEEDSKSPQSRSALPFVDPSVQEEIIITEQASYLPNIPLDLQEEIISEEIKEVELEEQAIDLKQKKPPQHYKTDVSLETKSDMTSADDDVIEAFIKPSPQPDVSDADRNSDSGAVIPLSSDKEELRSSTTSSTFDSEKPSEEPKKFRCKIKLRAVKSENKHGAKKWTLVGDNTDDGNDATESDRDCSDQAENQNSESKEKLFEFKQKPKNSSPQKSKLHKFRKSSSRVSAVNMRHDEPLKEVSPKTPSSTDIVTTSSSSPSSPLHSTSHVIESTNKTNNESVIEHKDPPGPTDITNPSVSLIMSSLKGCKETCLSVLPMPCASNENDAVHVEPPFQTNSDDPVLATALYQKKSTETLTSSNPNLNAAQSPYQDDNSSKSSENFVVIHSSSLTLPDDSNISTDDIKSSAIFTPSKESLRSSLENSTTNSTSNIVVSEESDFVLAISDEESSSFETNSASRFVNQDINVKTLPTTLPLDEEEDMKCENSTPDVITDSNEDSANLVSILTSCTSSSELQSDSKKQNTVSDFASLDPKNNNVDEKPCLLTVNKSIKTSETSVARKDSQTVENSSSDHCKLEFSKSENSIATDDSVETKPVKLDLNVASLIDAKDPILEKLMMEFLPDATSTSQETFEKQIKTRKNDDANHMMLSKSRDDLVAIRSSKTKPELSQVKKSQKNLKDASSTTQPQNLFSNSAVNHEVNQIDSNKDQVESNPNIESKIEVVVEVTKESNKSQSALKSSRRSVSKDESAACLSSEPVSTCKEDDDFEPTQINSETKTFELNTEHESDVDFESDYKLLSDVDDAVDANKSDKPALNSDESLDDSKSDVNIALEALDVSSPDLLDECSENTPLQKKTVSARQFIKMPTSLESGSKPTLRRTGTTKTRNLNLKPKPYSNRLKKSSKKTLNNSSDAAATGNRSSTTDVNDCTSPDSFDVINEVKKKRVVSYRRKIKRKRYFKQNLVSLKNDSQSSSSNNENTVPSEKSEISKRTLLNPSSDQSMSSVQTVNSEEDSPSISSPKLSNRGRSLKQWARGRKRKVHHLKSSPCLKKAKAEGLEGSSDRVQTRSITFDHPSGDNATTRKIKRGRGKKRTRGGKRNVCRNEPSPRADSESKASERSSISEAKRGGVSIYRGRGRRSEPSGQILPVRRSIRNFKNHISKKK